MIPAPMTAILGLLCPNLAFSLGGLGERSLAVIHWKIWKRKMRGCKMGLTRPELKGMIVTIGEIVEE